MTYSVVHLDQQDRFPDMSGAPVLMPLRRTLGRRLAAEGDDFASLPSDPRWKE